MREYNYSFKNHNILRDYVPYWPVVFVAAILGFFSAQVYLRYTRATYSVGAVVMIKNDDKSSYINFYYNGKKFALHRLLYINYIGELNDSEYIKFNCSNKGKCCNINHFYKILKSDNEEKKIETPKNFDIIEKKIENKDIVVDFNIYI